MDLDLIVTGSPDYNGTHEANYEFGCDATAMAELRATLSAWDGSETDKQLSGLRDARG